MRARMRASAAQPCSRPRPTHLSAPMPAGPVPAATTHRRSSAARAMRAASVRMRSHARGRTPRHAPSSAHASRGVRTSRGSRAPATRAMPRRPPRVAQSRARAFATNARRAADGGRTSGAYGSSKTTPRATAADTRSLRHTHAHERGRSRRHQPAERTSTRTRTLTGRRAAAGARAPLERERHLALDVCLDRDGVDGRRCARVLEFALARRSCGDAHMNAVARRRAVARACGGSGAARGKRARHAATRDFHAHHARPWRRAATPVLAFAREHARSTH